MLKAETSERIKALLEDSDKEIELFHLLNDLDTKAFNAIDAFIETLVDTQHQKLLRDIYTCSKHVKANNGSLLALDDLLGAQDIEVGLKTTALKLRHLSAAGESKLADIPEPAKESAVEVEVIDTSIVMNTKQWIALANNNQLDKLGCVDICPHRRRAAA